MKLFPTIYSVHALVALAICCVAAEPRTTRPNPSPAGYQVISPGKYYVEAGASLEEGHYDRRFFRGTLLDDSPRLVSLRLLIRSYLSQFHSLGIETWLAHGTLLGWRWNAKIMPWDGDLDVHISLQSLDYLAMNLNYSLHDFHYINELSGRAETCSYLLDVNPYYTTRVGDRSNVIDARWIDTSTGLFIDITGLAGTDPARPGELSCKNNHHYLDHDLFPLLESDFEGTRALVPRNFDRILTIEYGPLSIAASHFNGYDFDHKMKQWIRSPNIQRSERSESK